MQLWGFENRSSQFQPSGARFGLMQGTVIQAAPVVPTAPVAPEAPAQPTLTNEDRNFINELISSSSARLGARPTADQIRTAINTAREHNGITADQTSRLNGIAARVLGTGEVPDTAAVTQFNRVLDGRVAELRAGRQADFDQMAQAYRARGMTLSTFDLDNTDAFQAAVDGLTEGTDSLGGSTRGGLQRLQAQIRAREGGRRDLATAVSSAQQISTSSSDQDYAAATQRLSAVPRLGSGPATTAASGDPEAPQRPQGSEGQNNRRQGMGAGETVASVFGSLFGSTAEVVGGIAGLCAVVAAGNARASVIANIEGRRFFGMVTGAFMNGQAQAQQTSAIASAQEGIAAHQAHSETMQAMALTHLNRSPGSLLAGMNAEIAGGTVSPRRGSVCV